MGLIIQTAHKKSVWTLLVEMEICIKQIAVFEVAQWSIAQWGAVVLVPSGRMKSDQHEQPRNITFFVNRIAHKWAI